MEIKFVQQKRQFSEGERTHKHTFASCSNYFHFGLTLSRWTLGKPLENKKVVMWSLWLEKWRRCLLRRSNHTLLLSYCCLVLIWGKNLPSHPPMHAKGFVIKYFPLSLPARVFLLAMLATQILILNLYLERLDCCGLFFWSVALRCVI